MKNNQVYRLIFLIVLSYSLSLHSILVVAQRNSSSTPISFPVGVILDLETWLGRMANSCISIGITDFYAAHPNFRTRLVLHIRDSKKDDVDAAFAAMSLLNDMQVQAIIGPQASTQAEYVADLGGKRQVPIISFSATGLSLSSRTPYFIRMVPNDSHQVKAIATIVQTFGWKEIVLIYEDTNYGYGILPYLIDSFQKFDARITYRSAIPPSATKDRILEELNNMKRMQSRVFVVHMTSSPGTLFFLTVKDAGMMNTGYVWIITDGLTNYLDSMDQSEIDSMQGVLGIKPCVPQSIELNKLRDEFKNKFRQDFPNNRNVDVNPYGLFAYDTIWALGLAAERVASLNLSSQETKGIVKNTTGPELLKAIFGTKFKGLSGEIRLVNGQLELPVYKIVNVIGKGEREIGFWKPSHGISRALNVTRDYYSFSKDDLGPIIWPGESITIPKGWVDPMIGKTLRIGVPVTHGFNEFVKVEWDPITNATNVTGYCIEVFDLVMRALPYNVPYDYVPFQNANGESAGSYDDLIFQVYVQKYDAVVGDMTITASRSDLIDFSQPYTRGGVSMVVPFEQEEMKHLWIFFEPMTWNLWLTFFAFLIFTVAMIYFIEATDGASNQREKDQNSEGTDQKPIKIIWSSLLALILGQGEQELTESSKMIVGLWNLFLKLLVPLYIAFLVSRINNHHRKPTITDVKDLIENEDYVGCQQGSYVLTLLKKWNFNESKLRIYSSPEEYNEALMKGSKNGGVAAIFDQLPYIDLFLKIYCDNYTKVGPTYRMDGFGFVFPRGSTLTDDVSRALLSTLELEKMAAIEKKWFGRRSTCPDESNIYLPSQLSLRILWMLFPIMGIIMISSFSCSKSQKLKKPPSNPKKPTVVEGQDTNTNIIEAPKGNIELQTQNTD